MHKLVSLKSFKIINLFIAFVSSQVSIFILSVIFATAYAKPQVYVSPSLDVVSPYVVSSSSQYIARNFNGLSAAYVAESPIVSYSAYPSYPASYVF